MSRDVPAEARWVYAGRTTIELAQSSDGEWRATQVGTDVAGHGATAALAARDYCEKVAADDSSG